MNPKINLLITNLNEQLNFLDLEVTEPIKHSEKAIEMIVKSLENLKGIIVKNKFRTESEEILFFKEVKPQVFSKLIFYTKVLKIETKRPKGTDRSQRKYLMNELDKLKHFFDNNLEFYQYYRTGYEEILALTTLQLDSIYKSKNKVNFPIYSHGQIMSIGNYEGFKSSGKIGYIEDEKLKQKILNYYQISVPAINEVDRMYNDFLFKCFDKMIENADKSEEKLYSDPKFKKTIEFLVKLGKNNIRVYDKNTKPLAIELIKEIEKEMNK